MTSDRHQRAMQLFQQICELPEKERPAFLEQACQDDPDLRREVQSLLKHHSPATISTKPHVLTTKMPTGRQKRLLSQYMPRFRPRLPSWWPILTGLLLLALLVLIWRWVENGVRQQLTRSMEERLELVVRANVTALDNWFTTEKESVESWANNPALMRDVTQLVKDSQLTTSTVDLHNRMLDSDAAQRIRDRLEPTEGQAGELGVVIVRFDGRVLMHEDPSRVGEWIYPEFDERAETRDRRGNDSASPISADPASTRLRSREEGTNYGLGHADCQ